MTKLALDKIVSCAAEGLTLREAAARFGVGYQYLSKVSRQNGIKFKRKVWTGQKPNPNAVRNEQMVGLYMSGLTLQQIGDQFGITRERVRQLLRKQGVPVGAGGATLQHERTRAKRSARAEQACMRRHGCSVADLRALRRMGRAFMLEGGSRRQTPIGAFVQQRNNAKKRGIGFELKLWEWWSIWQASGKWAERGRGDGYVMCRKGDVGPYALGNVFIATGVENILEYHARRAGCSQGAAA